MFQHVPAAIIYRDHTVQSLKDGFELRTAFVPKDVSIKMNLLL